MEDLVLYAAGAIITAFTGWLFNCLTQKTNERRQFSLLNTGICDDLIFQLKCMVL